MSSTDYKHAKTGPFVQDAPVLTNPYTSDPILSRALKQLLPSSVCFPFLYFIFNDLEISGI